MATLTDLDRQLIGALRKDGRAPISALAEQLGVARATVTSRIQKLSAAGVIQGFSVRVREDADDHVRAISLIEVAGTNTDGVVDRLRRLPEVRGLHTTNGAWDLVVEIACEDLPGVDAVLRRIRGIRGVRNSETSLLLSSIVL